MRTVFMGTPEFAAIILAYLAEQHEVVGVFTRPDAVSGRGKKLVPSPVKQAAAAKGIPVFEYSSFKTEGAFETLEELAPEVIVVAAYGAILPKKVLDLPRYGCLNAHASDLPRWRGAAPIERAILAGDEAAGVCVMRMEEGLDTGDYCVSRTMEIGDFQADYLTERLADLGASAMLTAMAHIESGCPTWVKQDEERVTYAHKIEKGELDIAPTDTALFAARKVQASGASHPSRAILAGKGCTILGARLVAADDAALVEGLEQGEMRFRAKRLFLGCADGALEVLAVRPDGKKDMDAKAFAAGIQGIKQGGINWKAR